MHLSLRAGIKRTRNISRARDAYLSRIPASPRSSSSHRLSQPVSPNSLRLTAALLPTSSPEPAPTPSELLRTRALRSAHATPALCNNVCASRWLGRACTHAAHPPRLGPGSLCPRRAGARAAARQAELALTMDRQPARCLLDHWSCDLSSSTFSAPPAALLLRLQLPLVCILRRLGRTATLRP